MDVESEDSIAHIVNELYEVLRYENRHLGIHLGYVWTKDSGKIYVVMLDDLFKVMEAVGKKLEPEIILDYFKYKDMIVDLPFNLRFTVVRRES